MSSAGTKSSQGDDYQRLVALHWVIRLLDEKEEIAYIQAESNGLPGIDEKVSVDDVVVAYANGNRRHIQVKKNQPENRAWSLSDQSLAMELPKIRDQLERNRNTIVELYSRTPFGDFHSLAEASREYPDFPAFQRSTGRKLQDTLTFLAAKWERSQADSFFLLRRIEFGPHHSFQEWERQNMQELVRIVSHAGLALGVLESFLNKHQSKLRASTLIIHRDDVLRLLEKEGLALAPPLSEAEILGQFRQSSLIGREWERTVGGEKFVRPEFNDLVRMVEEGVNTVLVTDRPGSGKTCLLLDLADYIEQDPRFGLLFIKGDCFTHLKREAEFKEAGLPENIIGLCGRLSESRRIVVVIDSLDVLSLNRNHTSLNVFLRLIDRLQSVRNATVVAACRSFDLKYDPLLRDRKWTHEVNLADFDYDTVVAPLLKDWEVQEDHVDADLKRLLQLPQNLRLFESIAKRGERCKARNVFELQETFLEEVVRKNPDLGNRAITSLYKMAEMMLSDRDHHLPLAAFQEDEFLRRALVSNGVLFQDRNGQVGFAHQTLFDYLAACSSMARNENLQDFVKAHPPLPFLRPAVRTFFFYLRNHAPERFSRQVRAVLTDPEIAYHFKRLIAESLAEIAPMEEDWSLINWLFRNQPELFRRLFWRLEGDVWFRFLLEYWLPSLGSPKNDSEWYMLFLNQLKLWMNDRPADVIDLWKLALSEGWIEMRRLIWQIESDLHKFQHLKAEGIKEIIESLLKERKIEGRDLLGLVISRYVEATDQGDKLLWHFITKDLNFDETEPFSIGNQLHCESHDFHKKQFLEERLVQSELFLTMAINALEDWSESNDRYRTARRLRNAFLSYSSWELRHSRNDMHHVDGLTVLLNGIENALRHHAKVDDHWWHEHEPMLRHAQEETLRYFLVLAYKENPNANIEGIAVTLSDKELLQYGQIEHELGELIQASYHLLSPEVQENNQRVILDLYAEENWDEEDSHLWVVRAISDYLAWIPRIFRLPVSQAFIDPLVSQFGSALPEPNIHSWGGCDGSPIPFEKLLKLDNRNLFRLLGYYNDYHDYSSHPADDNKGGRETVERVLFEAATYDPKRYFELIPALESHGLQPGYRNKVLEGIAQHIRYRFGRLRSPQDWQPIEPAPDGSALARSLLDVIERTPDIWDEGHAVVHMLEACCEVLEDNDSAERLVFHLFRLLRQPDPDEDRQRIFRKDKKRLTSEDLRHEAINSVRGIAAGVSIRFYTRFLEQDREPPELLFPLLRHFARDPVMAVRAALLDYLPYLTFKRHELGWQLFYDIFRERQDHLWPLAERHLYHQYMEYFDDVAPCLDRICAEAIEEGRGRLGKNCNSVLPG